MEDYHVAKSKVATVLEGMRGHKAHRQIMYDDKGRTIEDRDLTEPVKRKPLPKGMTVKSLEKEIRERLAKAVVATVIKRRSKNQFIAWRLIMIAREIRCCYLSSASGWSLSARRD